MGRIRFYCFAMAAASYKALISILSFRHPQMLLRQIFDSSMAGDCSKMRSRQCSRCTRDGPTRSPSWTCLSGNIVIAAGPLICRNISPVNNHKRRFRPGVVYSTDRPESNMRPDCISVPQWTPPAVRDPRSARHQWDPSTDKFITRNLGPEAPNIDSAICTDSGEHLFSQQSRHMPSQASSEAAQTLI